MPELPEVEVITRGLHETVRGKTVERVETWWPTSLREEPESFASRVEGRIVEKVERRAKLALIRLSGDLTLAVHLKMTGRLVHGPMKERHKHDRIRFVLDDGSALVFADMRRFGYISAMSSAEIEEWAFWKKLGPEPLEIGAGEFADRFQGRRTRIKALLLDQCMIAGIGNIYADESLFRAGIAPSCPASCLSREDLKSLHGHLQDVLRQAISENGSSISDYRDSGGNAGAFQNRFLAYGRKGQECTRCKEVLVAEKVAGRTSTFCPACQKKG